MATQLPYRPSTRPSFTDDATDSGYGGSIIDGSSNDSSENFVEKPLPKDFQSRHQIPADRQQEIYQENCRLLTGSIEDTKYILKVIFAILFITTQTNFTRT
jgi:hypothetical protein